MQMPVITTFEEAEAYLYDIPRFTAKNTLEDTRHFLKKLGGPDRKLKILHVAGTNGKGSVCAYMRSILEAQGKRVAMFTSPHLVELRERFVIEGEMISRESFLKAFLQVYHLIDCPETYHPTFFEYLFFIGMLVFAEAAPDYCILETGLGGRLDATNAVERKELAVITHISLDHVEYLGDTVEKIAGEKAEIMRPGCPVVFWETSEATNRVFLQKAAELGSPVDSVSKSDYHFQRIQNKSIDFSVRTRYYNTVNFTIHTIAHYQMENAALAVRAIQQLEGEAGPDVAQLQAGIGRFSWAGRMEEVRPGVYVDGAHNADGIRAFLETVEGDIHQGKRTLLFGVVKEKNYEEMIRELMGTGLFQQVAITRLQTGRSMTPEQLMGLFREYPDCKCTLFENAADAFRTLLRQQEQDERIYIVGSLYLVGEIKELCGNDKF